MAAMSYHLSVTVQEDFDCVAPRPPFAAEGVGIVSEIDMAATLLQKLGHEMQPYIVRHPPAKSRKEFRTYRLRPVRARWGSRADLGLASPGQQPDGVLGVAPGTAGRPATDTWTKPERARDGSL
jgi:hypothetical protein